MTPDKLVEGFRHPGEPCRHPRRDVGYVVCGSCWLTSRTPPKRLQPASGMSTIFGKRSMFQLLSGGAPDDLAGS